MDRGNSVEARPSADSRPSTDARSSVASRPKSVAKPLQSTPKASPPPEGDALSILSDGEDSDDGFFDAKSMMLSKRFKTKVSVGGLQKMSSSMALPRVIPRVPTLELIPMTGPNTRTTVPPPKNALKRPSVWGMLKDSVGKDLSKISIPVEFNEPISFLQRMAEDLEYSELLDDAAKCPDLKKRLLLVGTFAVSHYASTIDRLAKPFNPLLNETFSHVNPKKGDGIRLVAEQVSHHPPVGVIYAEGGKAAWTYKSAIEVKNKFWGKSLEVFPTGWNHVTIDKYDDHFVYEHPTTCVHNIVVGKLWIDNYGDVLIRDHNTGMYCIISIQKTGWMADKKNFGKMTGQVYDSNDNKLPASLSGNWDRSVTINVDGVKSKVWEVKKRPPPSASAYNQTAWVIELNAKPDAANKMRLPPTDSRFRPDQRLLEEGMFDEANETKSRIEEKQRARRKDFEARGEPILPVWFKSEMDEVTNVEDYKFGADYFVAMKNGDWSKSPPIF